MSLTLVIERPGFASTLQDRGRFGVQRFGIPASGAMDTQAFSLANALAGNPEGTAAVEMAMTGLSARVEGGSCRLALAGADMDVQINGRRLAGWRAYGLDDGDRIEIGPARTGVYAYLAIAGGVAIAPTLGSFSTHSRSGIGGFEGRALRSGDRLPLVGAAPASLLGLPEAERPTAPAGPIRVVLGPQAEAFSEAGLATFLGQAFQVTTRSDRMGMQLDGPAIAHRDGFNIVSDGIALGSIQVPGHGLPVVLLADRQTTGGYPKIATVIGADLPRLVQSRPGDTICFAAIGRTEAEAEARRQRGALLAAIARMRPVVSSAADLASADLLQLNLVGGVTSALASPFQEGA